MLVLFRTIRFCVPFLRPRGPSSCCFQSPLSCGRRTPLCKTWSGTTLSSTCSAASVRSFFVVFFVHPTIFCLGQALCLRPWPISKSTGSNKRVARIASAGLTSVSGASAVTPIVCCSLLFCFFVFFDVLPKIMKNRFLFFLRNALSLCRLWRDSGVGVCILLLRARVAQRRMGVGHFAAFHHHVAAFCLRYTHTHTLRRTDTQRHPCLRPTCHFTLCFTRIFFCLQAFRSSYVIILLHLVRFAAICSVFRSHAGEEV